MANEYAYTKDPDKKPMGKSALARKNTNREIGAEENINKKIKKKEKKTLEEKLRKEQSSMMKENFDTMSRKNFKEAKEDYKKVDQGFKKNKSDDDKIKISSFKGRNKPEKVFNEIDASKREAGRVVKAKGGRINFKGGGCAIRGIKKNAYGKNS